jgi:DNA polymerase III epsilon subunit-like protein
VIAVVVDTETTGLPSSKYAQPVSIGAVAVDTTTGVTVSEFYCLVRPTVVHWKEYMSAFKIHGISLSDLEADGLYNDDAIIEFKDWWVGLSVRFDGDLGPRPMLYAFNVSFDSVMLKRMGFDPKGYWGPCLMQTAARHLNRPSGRVSLDHAAKTVGAARANEEHNALEDARLASYVALATGAW